MRLRNGYATTAIASLCGAIAMSCAVAVEARADVFGPISIVSEGTLAGGVPEQAEYAHDAAISGNGRYVAFDGAVGGRTGVWRRDLTTGAIEQVANGEAELPSISASGRYVSFTSTEDLVLEDEPIGVNVWVRDMEPGPGEPEYALVSAVDGSDKGLTYEYPEPERERSEFGAVATGRSAISADGRKVAFVTTAVSDLAGPRTPKLQVALRDLSTKETTLVSGAYDPLDGQTTSEPVSLEAEGEHFGAVYPGIDGAFRMTPANGEWAGSPPPGASISADGTTVAWMGEDIAKQVRTLAAEQLGPLYTEPLWRRIVPGSQTPTERVTGGSDPEDSACFASGEAALPSLEAQSSSDPCQGPFRVELTTTKESRGIWSEVDSGVADFVPRLSADGYTVAFVASAVPIARGVGLGGDARGEPADLYVADMHQGLTRTGALTPVTELAGTGVAASNPITDFDISPDGSQVAFTTRRTEFPLGFPAYVSSPAAVPGESELFDANLGDDTLTQVSSGYEGGPSFQPHGSLLECKEEEDPYCNHPTEGAQSPSFSENELIAFSSTASNLVYGDGNTPPAKGAVGVFDGSDAFVVGRQVFSPLPTPQEISPAPDTPTDPQWQLGVTEQSRPNGTVLLYVQVPDGGEVRVSAQSAVVVAPSNAARNARRIRRSHRASTRSAHQSRTVATRTVAVRTAQAGGAGLLTLTLALAPRYTSLADAHGGLSATATVTFTAPGHPALRQSVPVAFLRKPDRSKAARARRSARTSHAANRGHHPTSGGRGA